MSSSTSAGCPVTSADSNPAVDPVHLLIVDDDDVDVLTLKRAFSRLAIGNPVAVARSGVEALDLLRTQDPGHGRFVVLLDLNMPRMDGIEFLAQLRQDARLRYLPVFVLSTSSSREDKLRAYGHAISGYLVKPDGADGFLAIASLLQQYIETVELPDDSGA